MIKLSLLASIPTFAIDVLLLSHDINIGPLGAALLFLLCLSITIRTKLR